MRTGPFGSQYRIHGSVVLSGWPKGPVGGISASIFSRAQSWYGISGSLPRSFAPASTVLTLMSGWPRHAPDKSGTPAAGACAWRLAASGGASANIPSRADVVNRRISVPPDVNMRRSLLDEGSSLQVADRLLNFLPRVHDDRSIPRDRLFDRLARDQQKADAVFARLDDHLVAAIEDDQRAVAYRF